VTTPHHRNPGTAEHWAAQVALLPRSHPDAARHLTAEPRRREHLLQAAFFGRTNGATDDLACVSIAKRFHVCENFCAGRAVITDFFYDFNRPIDQAVARRVREWGGPPERHGGWSELADLLPSLLRDIDLLVCYSLDRIGRRRAQFGERGALLNPHGLPLICADTGCWEEMTPWLTGEHGLLSSLASDPVTELPRRREQQS
jgi:hypothetical protein